MEMFERIDDIEAVRVRSPKERAARGRIEEDEVIGLGNVATSDELLKLAAESETSEISDREPAGAPAGWQTGANEIAELPNG